MRAIAIAGFETGPELHDLPTPEPGPGEVLVRVHSASLNGFDVAVAAGMLQGMMEHRFPIVLGKDYAGTVAAVGDGVTSVEPCRLRHGNPRQARDRDRRLAVVLRL